MTASHAVKTKIKKTLMFINGLFIKRFNPINNMKTINHTVSENAKKRLKSLTELKANKYTIINKKYQNKIDWNISTLKN